MGAAQVHFQPVGSADDNPITFDSGQPCTLAMLIRWINTSGTQGIFPFGLLEQRATGCGGALLRQALGPERQRRQSLIRRRAHDRRRLTLVRVWTGQQVRQYVNGVRTDTRR
jgi:hypothetical protein